MYTYMHTNTQAFHDTVERVSEKWVRRNREMPEPVLGATLPVLLLYILFIHTDIIHIYIIPLLILCIYTMLYNAMYFIYVIRYIVYDLITTVYI